MWQGGSDFQWFLHHNYQVSLNPHFQFHLVKRIHLGYKKQLDIIEVSTHASVWNTKITIQIQNPGKSNYQSTVFVCVLLWN